MASSHVPVLIDQVIKSLETADKKTYIDCTFGAGGYTLRILEAANCNVIGVDRDPDVKIFAQNVSKKYPDRFKFIEGSFGELKDLFSENGIEQVDAIILDLGVSSMQIDQAERGFSFSKDAALDMRMSKEGVSAYDFVNNQSEEVIADVLYKFGDEKFSRKIASKIVYLRSLKPIETTFELAEIIRSVMPGKFRGHRTDPATKSFQAIRIWVNDELEQLNKVLESSLELVKVGGKIIVVTFHSTEDRIVKNFFNQKSIGDRVVSRYLPDQVNDADGPILKVLNKKAIPTSDEEIESNVRSRSAKLRAAVKIREVKNDFKK
jgi:16S rRNA (cytosine1402-N4)-methyltransferase